jgi:tRNA (adenine37-N6)-methyltransferase
MKDLFPLSYHAGTLEAPVQIPMEPIGMFWSSEMELYQCPHQPLDGHANCGEIELYPQKNFEQALEGLETFSHIWVIFLFHGAGNWRPKIMPPRGDVKRGCLATRTPHRPNSIGMSVLELKSIQGRRLKVGQHDLLHGTPVLDLKPYLPKVDMIPNANGGWTDTVDSVQASAIEFSEFAQRALDWLLERQLDLWALVETTLVYYPEPRKRKRTKWLDAPLCELACKTWRIRYELNGSPEQWKVKIVDIDSGYPREIIQREIPSDWMDLDLHDEYLKWKNS